MILQVMYGLLSVASEAAPPAPGVGLSLVGAVQNNPTLAALGVLLAAFLAGFGVKKFFEDRQLAKIHDQLEEAQKRLDGVTAEIQKTYDKQAAATYLAAQLRDFLSPEVFRGPLAKYLQEFPPERHDALLAAVVRQALMVPGVAWLFAPSATVKVYVDFDEARNASHVRTEVDALNDPIHDLREAIKSQPQLLAAMLELSIYGITRVAVNVDADHRTHMTAMQGPWLNVSTSTDDLQRLQPSSTAK